MVYVPKQTRKRWTEPGRWRKRLSNETKKSEQLKFAKVAPRFQIGIDFLF